MSFLRHYKINMKTSNELPKKCKVTCKRLHFTRSAATAIAENTTLVSEENRAKLLAKIASDKKYS